MRTLRGSILACAAGLMAAFGGLAGSAFTAQAAEGPGPKLYVFDCGVLLYNSPQRFGYQKGEVATANLSDGCFLIDDPGKGTLIWDTGVIPDRMWRPNGAPPKKEYGEGTIPLRDQLAAIGRKPEDITFVAVSHAHWDHVSNLYEFARSTWLTQASTRDQLLSDKPGDKLDPTMFEALKTTKTVTLPKDGDYDVFGDGAATIMPAPGHTPDSAVLVVRLKHHRPVILVGDLYHFAKDLETGKIAPNENAEELRASRARVQALAKKIGAEIWVAHDWNAFAALHKSPAFYQ